jgi:hypothetical protein
MDTAEDFAFFFNAVANNPTPAVRTLGRQGMNCALEAVEHMRLAGEGHLERFVVIISANFTESHKMSGSIEVRLAGNERL